MTNERDTVDFSDLDELPGAEHLKGYQPLDTSDLTVASQQFQERTLKSTTRQRVEVPCEFCRGRGRFISYTGRDVGPCYRCNGSGKILRAAGYAENKAKREAKKVAVKQAEEAELEAGRQRRIDAYRAKQPEIYAWLANNPASDFALSLREAVARYGSLSVAQEAAVRRSLGTYVEPGQLPRSGDMTDLDISSLKGFYAVPDGETRLKLCVRHPGKNSKYHGWIFVDDGAAYGQRRTYGKQLGKTGRYTGKVQEQLRAILADPLAAQVAYGRLTGVCGVCGRLLEDEQSVAAGIGPICAGKMGA